MPQTLRVDRQADIARDGRECPGRRSLGSREAVVIAAVAGVLFGSFGVGAVSDSAVVSTEVTCHHARRVTVTLEQTWPAFSLRVEAGPLTLRAMRDDDLPALDEAAASGIHSVDLRPFPNSWASGDAASLGRELGGRYWTSRASLGQARSADPGP